jgi:hypothetical protein
LESKLNQNPQAMISILGLASYLSMTIELPWSRVIAIFIQLDMFDTLLLPFQIKLFLVQFLQSIIIQ